MPDPKDPLGILGNNAPAVAAPKDDPLGILGDTPPPVQTEQPTEQLLVEEDLRGPMGGPTSPPVTIDEDQFNAPIVTEKAQKEKGRLKPLSEEGSVGGGTWNELVGGASKTIEDMSTMTLLGLSLVLPEGAGGDEKEIITIQDYIDDKGITPEQIGLTQNDNLGRNLRPGDIESFERKHGPIEEKSATDKAASAVGAAVDKMAIKETLDKGLKSEGTSEEYIAKLKSDNIFAEGLFGLSGSLYSMSTLQMSGFFATGVADGYKTMETAYPDLPAEAKVTFGAASGLIMLATEKLGVKWLTKNKGAISYITNKFLKSAAGKNIKNLGSHEAMQLAIQISDGFVAEGFTGASDFAGQEALKQTTDLLTGEDKFVFEGTGKFVKGMLHQFAVEGIGGGIMKSGQVSFQGAKEGGKKLFGKGEITELQKLDPEDEAGLDKFVKQKVSEGEIKPEDAEKAKTVIRADITAAKNMEGGKIPEGKEGEVHDLIKEKNAIQEKQKNVDKTVAETLAPELEEADGKLRTALGLDEKLAALEELKTEESVEETSTEVKEEVVKMEPEATKSKEKPPAVKTKTEAPELTFEQPKEVTSSKFVEKPVGEISTDVDRFQNRTELDQEQVDRIKDNWNENDLDPIVIWKDENGKDFLLAGHHRLEAATQRGNKDITSRYFEGTEAEAIEYATERSNANRTLEADYDRAKVFRKMREDGRSKSDIKEALHQEGRNKVYIENISHLNPTGKSMESLQTFGKAGDRTTQKIIERIADFVVI